MLYKYTFNYNPITAITLLYQQVTIYSRYSNRYWILLDLPTIVTLVKQFAAIFLFCWLRDISNKAAGYLKKQYKFVVVGLAEQQFCRQNDLLIDCNLQLYSSLLLPRRHTAISAKMPCQKYTCLIQFSAASKSAKILTGHTTCLVL
jgi:hypothetical protein